MTVPRKPDRITQPQDAEIRCLRCRAFITLTRSEVPKDNPAAILLTFECPAGHVMTTLTPS
jgi:hypothetical protein